MKQQLLIVFPSRAGTGLRHGVLVGAERALCGRNVDNFYIDRSLDGDDPATIGCKPCQRAWRQRAESYGSR